jgi:GT2 family glycosyltransferase
MSRDCAVSVVIPSYRRADALERCVDSLLGGTVRPDEIIVVGRKGDEPTERAVGSMQSTPDGSVCLRSAWVTAPGHIPPVETGLGLASGHVVAMVDDDVTVSREWLENILPHFSDPTVGVVGGRVVVPGGAAPRLKGRPGRVSWYGKTWGNVASVQAAHAFEVDAVIECNWAWRRNVLRSIPIDATLNFDDASMYGLDLCLQAKAKGFRVIYEPAALVYHHVEPRTPELDRAQRGKRTFSYCRNYTYIMLRRLPWWRRAAFLMWWFGVGERNALGALALLVETSRWGRGGRREFRSALAGKVDGVRLWLGNRGSGN